MNKRENWLDQLKGLSVIFGTILYFLPILMIEKSNAIINELNLMQFLKFYFPLGIILISGFSVYLKDTFTNKWWFSKFFSLVILSSWFYLIGQDESHYYYIMVSCLFFYYPLWAFLKKQSGLEKILTNIIMALIYIIGLKLSPELVETSVGGRLTDAGAWQLFLYNLLSGLPMIILGSWIIPLVLQKKPINNILIFLLSLILIDYLLYSYVLTWPVTSGYPPMLRQTWFAAFVIIGLIKCSNIQFSWLINYGKNSLINYWTLWLMGTLFISWNGFLKHQLSLEMSLLLILITNFFYAILKSKLFKSGIKLKE